MAPPDLTIPRCELDDITGIADVVRSHRPTVGGVARVSSPSLTETGGLAEISETITSVAPGDSVPSLPYQMLL